MFPGAARHPALDLAPAHGAGEAAIVAAVAEAAVGAGAAAAPPPARARPRDRPHPRQAPGAARGQGNRGWPRCHRDSILLEKIVEMN